MDSTRGFSHNTDDTRARPSMERPYRDSATPGTMSPPPQYAPVEPIDSRSTSPSRPLFPEAAERYTMSSGDRSSDTYVDELASPPPPPPPHRTSPTRSIHRNSISRVSTGGRPSGMGNTDVSAGGPESDQASQDPYLPDGGSGANTNQQLPVSQANDRPELFHPHPQVLRPHSRLPESTSYSSNMPFAAGAATPGSITPASTPDVRSSRYSGRSIPLEDYSGSLHYPMANYYNDSPYRNSGYKFDPTVSDASINPYDIADDGDDGFMPHPKRKSGLPLNAFRSKGPAVSTVGSESTAAGGAMGGILGKQMDNQVETGSYGPVDGANSSEKAEWRAIQDRKKKKRKLIMIMGMLLVVILIIVAGVVGGVIGSHNSKGSSSGSTNNADDDTSTNGDLDLNSAEIKKLLNNPNLHKVFPGMDYTPWGVQYPLCLTYPPSQNNVTRDMAVLSQLTNTVRLYGTDCNQTEMVLHAIDQLKLTDMKVWLGVWVDTNQTTTDRQVENMYKILANVKDKSIFKGAIIGNEALYRAGEDKAQSKQELITLLTDTRSNFTSLGYSLPIATSDLGDNWTGDLVAVSDYVMSNIHPFFAGVTADVAAAWTWNFWQTKDVPLTTNTNVKQIISETGWPSGGGTDCGGSDGSCAAGQSGSVASIANMNIFMSDWVCQALANGTDYFWFEAFDEPWKVQYNTATQQWEDKWGLMDQARNLKSGIQIPDCGGKTVSS